MGKEFGKYKRIEVPVLNFFLTLVSDVLMRREYKLSKELGESKRIPIPVINFFLTLKRDIL